MLQLNTREVTWWMVYAERAETAPVSCGTSHVSAVNTPLWWILKNALVTYAESHASAAVSLLESGEQRCIKAINNNIQCQTSGAVWKSRWPSWAPRPNEPYGFYERKANTEPCTRTGHSLSLIRQPTSEDMKLYIIINNFQRLFCLALRDTVSGRLPADPSQRRGRPAVWPWLCAESGTTEILLIVGADSVCQLLS